MKTIIQPTIEIDLDDVWWAHDEEGNVRAKEVWADGIEITKLLDQADIETIEEAIESDSFWDNLRRQK